MSYWGVFLWKIRYYNFMNIWIYAILGVIFSSVFSLFGVLIFLIKKDWLSKIVPYLVSLAAGALFGDAFVHLIPDSFDNIKDPLVVSLLVLGGIVLFFMLEQFVRWRHCHLPDFENHTHPMVTMNIVGDAIHNFIDGVVIGASFLISIPIGIATTLAVFLHEIPQEIGDFGIMLKGGYQIKKAFLVHILIGLIAIVGTVVVLIIGPIMKGFAENILPMVAGGFIYVAGSDLVPEIHQGTDVKISVAIKHLLVLLAGILLMGLLLIVG